MPPPKMPVRPPILANPAAAPVLAGPAVEPGRLRHLVAGPGPTARRPALDATRRRQRRHRLRPGPPDSPDARYVLPANAAGAVPQDNAIDPGHEYTLAELIDLAQSSNPRTRIAWNAARNAALATGMVKSVYLPQLAATAMTAGATATAPATSAWETPPATAARTAPWACSLQWLLFDFGGRQRVQAAEQATIAGNVALTAVHQQLVQEVSVAYHGYIARARTVNARRAWSMPAPARCCQRALPAGQGTVVEVAQATQNREQARLATVTADGAEQDAYLALITAMGISPLAQPRIAALPDHALSPALAQPVEQIITDALARRPTCWPPTRPSRPNRPRRAADSDFLPRSSCPRRPRTPGALVHHRRARHRPAGRHRQPGRQPFRLQRLPGRDAAAVRRRPARGGADAARNDAASAGERLTRAKQDATRQIVAARNALRSGIAANEAAVALLKAARVTYDAASAAYRNGVGSLTDATLAQSQMLVAQNAYADSIATRARRRRCWRWRRAGCRCWTNARTARPLVRPFSSPSARRA